MTAVRNRQGSQPDHMAHSYRQHQELLGLVEGGDTDAALDLLERHIRFKGESFWAVPDSGPDRFTSTTRGTRNRTGLPTFPVNRTRDRLP